MNDNRLVVYRIMYWTSCGSNPSISTASMNDGEGRRVLVDYTFVGGIQCPLALAIDFAGKFYGEMILKINCTLSAGEFLYARKRPMVVHF